MTKGTTSPCLLFSFAAFLSVKNDNCSQTKNSRNLKDIDIGYSVYRAFNRSLYIYIVIFSVSNFIGLSLR